jgi:GNAT superfamily N-acetyltransferase
MIRPARPGDVDAIVQLVRDLADYERAAERVQLTAEQLRAALFGERPAVFAHVAVDGAGADVVGYAVWFVTYSTWLGRHGVHLEDLYVRPEHRGHGHGRALMATLAGLCTERGYGRLEWSVLDWNDPAIRFYRSLGAEGLAEWTTHRLSGEALAALADQRLGPGLNSSRPPT